MTSLPQLPQTPLTSFGFISPSKLKKLRTCAARAVHKAAEDDAMESKHEATLAGTLAHAAAKFWYRPNPLWVQAVQQTRFIENWQTRVCNGVEKHVIMDPMIALKMAIREVGGGNELPKDAESVQVATLYFQKIVEVFNRDRINIVFSEQRYKGILASGLPYHLIIDLGIDNGQGGLDIIDFKTGVIRIDNDEMWNDDQCLLNLLATSRDPALNRFQSKAFCFYWVQDNDISKPVSLDPAQLTIYEEYLLTSVDQLAHLTPANAKETPNRFCGSCERRFKCGAYGQRLAEAFGRAAPLTEAEMASLGDNALMEHAYRLKYQADILEDAFKVVKAELGGRISRAGITEMQGERLKARMRSMNITSMDVSTVLAEAGKNNIPPHTVLSVSGEKAKLAFAQIPSALAALDRTAHKVRSSTWVEVAELSAKDLKLAQKGK